MVKIFFLCTRRPEITHAAYALRVLEVHAPLAIAHHPSMRRYVINVTEGCPNCSYSLLTAFTPHKCNNE